MLRRKSSSVRGCKTPATLFAPLSLRCCFQLRFERWCCPGAFSPEHFPRNTIVGKLFARPSQRRGPNPHGKSVKERTAFAILFAQAARNMQKSSNVASNTLFVQHPPVISLSPRAVYRGPDRIPNKIHKSDRAVLRYFTPRGSPVCAEILPDKRILSASALRGVFRATKAKSL